ncbi:hypothetical protein SE13_22635, partial [Salmonella enterica subsp. enterica serovar Thompson]
MIRAWFLFFFFFFFCESRLSPAEFTPLYMVGSVRCKKERDPDETKNPAPRARALFGTRPAGVVKTPPGDDKARAIPAGNLELQAQGRT